MPGDITQNTALVVPSSTSSQVDGVSGEAFGAGSPVYKASNNADVDTYWKAKCNGTAEQSGYTGATSIPSLRIALSTAAGAGQPMKFLQSGEWNTGNTTLTVGATYAVSNNAGSIFEVSNFITSNYVSILGTANSATNLKTPVPYMFATGILHA